MPDATYALVFQGNVLDGFERPQVMQRFGELFGLPVEEVERVFGHPRVVLKRNLSRDAADAFRARLEGIGMAVSLDGVRVTAGRSSASVPTGTRAEAAPAGAASATIPSDAAASPPEQAAEPVQEKRSQGGGALAATGASASAASTTSAGRAAGAAAGDVEAAEPVARAAGAPPFFAATSPASAGPAEPVRELPFEFSGQGFEFFRIWIVNILLSIVTLGVYSAWAKVRTQRYFYGNTRLDGASFEYLADPIRILKGRLIAFGFLVVYMLADQFVPLLGALLMLVLIGVLPWVMVRSLAFRNHYSAWCGVRFGFGGSMGEAYKVFLLWPLLGVLSLGLLFPYALCRQQAFIVGNSRYGVTPFVFEAGKGAFYRLFLPLIGLMFVGGVLTAILAPVFPALGPVVMVVAYLVAFALFSVRMTNLVYNNTAIEGHRLQADYRLASYAALMLTNMLALVLTLGLFYPWARVRTARYAAEHIRLEAEGDLDDFAAGQRQELSAMGSEVGDLFDMDVGI